MDNDFELAVGHSFQFRSTPVPNWDGIIGSEVRIVEANKTLSYTWSALGLESIVTWTLSPTRYWYASPHGALRLRPRSGSCLQRRKHYGWQKFIGNLDRLVAEL